MKERKERTFAEKAYTLTEIDYLETQNKIIEMLNQLGITDVRFTQQGDDYLIEFIVRMRHGEHPRRIRINIPIEYDSDMSTRERRKKRDQAFRVLYYNLKNRFVSVTNHLKEFEEEFLSDLVIVNNGNEMRLGDLIAPKYKHLLKDSPVAIIHLNEPV